MAGAEWTQEKFQALTTYSADIISLLDGEGRLLFNSPATVRINGFTPEELKDKDTFELIHPDDRAEVRRVMGEVLSAPGSVRTVEYRYRTKDGRWLWMEAVASNQLDNPAVRGVVANSRDISERKKAESERLRMEQQLLSTQKLESLGVMAGGVAHGFNNLLALILGEASVLKQTLGPAAAESLATIESAAQRASELTQQLLAYAGRRLSLMEPTNLARLIDELAPLLRLSARGAVSLELKLDHSTPHVLCDRGQLRQVLLNLVLNATEATSGTGTVSVRLAHRDVSVEELGKCTMVSNFQPGHAVVLEVHDTGTGMSPQTLERIFDPYFTTKQSGRGLGLAAVSGVLRSHEAGLCVESKPGEGTTFRLYLRPSRTGEARLPPRSTARFTGKALVVDDDTFVGKTSARLLRTLGLECEVFSSGHDAVERFKADPAAFALVVCDVLMPNLDGPQTVSQLRALRSDVPVLYMSGFNPDPDLLAGDALTGFLAKPFDALAVSRALSLLLRPDEAVPQP